MLKPQIREEFFIEELRIADRSHVYDAKTMKGHFAFEVFSTKILKFVLNGILQFILENIANWMGIGKFIDLVATQLKDFCLVCK